jgi:hypothetical protein
MRIDLATDVLFDFDRADLLPKAQATLSQAAGIIRDKAKGSAAFQQQVPPGQNDGIVHDIPRGAGTDHSENEFVGGYRVKKIWSVLHHRIVWTIGAALLAIVAVPAIVSLVLKALGLVHGASLHTWLHDVGLNVSFSAAVGSLGAGVAGSASNRNSYPDPCESERNAVYDAKQKVESAENRVNVELFCGWPELS